MGIKFSNNAWGLISTAINAVDTTLILQSGHGARFPALAAGDYFYATLVDQANNLEIVKITARATDTLTMVRGQDSTTARSYTVGDRLELRPCAIALLEVIAAAQANSVINTAPVDVASAATTDIGAAASMNVRITGTTGITSLGVADAGLHRSVRFAAALTLTHSANLVLPGVANITTAANDRMEALSLGAGVWFVMFYQKANGQAVVAPAAGVTSVNGNTGAVTAAQISAAATAGYGYTPANNASLASYSLTSHTHSYAPTDARANVIGGICGGGASSTTNQLIVGNTYTGSGTTIGGNWSTGGLTVSGTWRCLFVMPSTTINNYTGVFQRIA